MMIDTARLPFYTKEEYRNDFHEEVRVYELFRGSYVNLVRYNDVHDDYESSFFPVCSEHCQRRALWRFEAVKDGEWKDAEIDFINENTACDEHYDQKLIDLKEDIWERYGEDNTW